MKRFYKELIKKALLSTFIVLFSMISFATTYYVSNAGSDGANGLTANTAWATLAYAEANATTAGCIIALKKGDTWLIDNVLDINSGGTVGKPIVWDGSLWGTGANAIIQANSDGGAVPKYYTICKISGCSYVTFQNITINGNNKYRTGIVVGGSHLVYGPTQQNNESNIIIQGCSILNCGNNLNYTQGILIETWNNDISDITIQRNIVDGTDTETIAIYNGRSDLGATPSEVSNCYIGYNTCTNFGRKGSFGIGVQINNKVTNTIVEHNTITTGASGFGHGLSCESNEPNTGYFPTNITYRYNDVRVTTRSAFLAQSGQAKTALVHNNLFYSANPLNGVIAINASASPAWTGALLKFYNNTIVHAEGYGYVSDSNVASTCEFKNNIVVRNVANTNAAMLNISNANSTIKNNNCYYRTSGTRIAVIAGGSKFAADMATIEPTAVLGNPLLTNLATYDFHLQAGSPTIDAGNPSSAFDSDGTRADIGALYYNHTVVNTLPTAYNVTGGGSYCNGGSGVAIGLSNSQTGVNYQLKLNGVNNVTALAGTGSVLSFGNKTVAGNYTVVATNVSTSVIANMTGSAIVTVNPLPTVTITGETTPVSLGSTGNVYTTQSGMSNYLWNVSAGGIVTSGGGSSNNTVTVTWNTAGVQSISVNYTNATGCTASSATNYPVTVNSLPTTYNVTGGGSYCNGGSGVAVVLSNSQIGVNYQLQLGGINNGTTLAGSGNAINFGNKTAAGNYTVVATNVSTLLTANMTGSATVAVNPIYSIIENITIKQGQVYNSWTQSGQYMRTLSSISGCDSIVTTNLNVIAPELLTEYKSICEGSNYNGWVISGKYERTLIAASGGDIIITTYLTVNPKYAINENITITEGGTYQGWTTSGQYTRTLMSISGCDSIVTTNLTVEKLVIKGGGIAPVHFITSWNGLTGLNLMNITVASAILEDLPLSTDDEIAVFSGTSCVGAKKLTQSINLSDNSTFLSIPASQNDGSNNGFNTIDTIIFKIWDNKNQKEMIAKAVTYRHDLSTWLTTGKYAPGALSTVEIVSYTEYTQTIQLKKGNNLFSTYVTPTNPNVSVVMKSLVTQKALIKMQDEAGNSFENWGSFGGWINNVGSIEITEGYKMKVANNCTLNVTGRLIALPLDISLKTGWNIISFPHTDMIDAMSVIQSLIELNKLVKVQDEIGNSIENWGISGGWKNGIGYFIPGKAYKVKMNADAIITIQQNYTKSAVIMATTEKTDHFLTGIEGNGTDHMNINLVSLNESDLVIGDELAAFDGDICVGTLKITESHLVNGSASLIASFSTDDKNKDGFKEGNQIQIIAWNHLSGNESKVEAELVNGQMSYEKNASVLVQMESLSTGIKGFEDLVTINVFPNPSKGRITIRFSEIPDAGSRIDILDISGRKVTSRLITGTSEEFNLDQQPAGIYLVKSIIDSKEKIHKLIITK